VRIITLCLNTYKYQVSVETSTTIGLNEDDKNRFDCMRHNRYWWLISLIYTSTVPSLYAEHLCTWPTITNKNDASFNNYTHIILSFTSGCESQK